MKVELVVASGNKAGQSIQIPVSKFFIGRAEDCHLRPKSDLVSRHHCVLIVEEGYFAVRDFGSKNGTFVNGQRVAGEQELKTGDHLTVGQLEFEIKVTAPVGAPKKPKVTSVQEAAARTAETAAQAPAEESGDDMDLGDWFGGGSEDEASHDEDTRTIELSAAVGSDTSENHLDEETVSAPSDEGAAADKKPDPAHKGPGAPKRASATSQDAAANMLRSFFKGR